VCSVVGGVCAAFTPLSVLTNLVSIGTLLSFVIVRGAVLVLRRRRPDLERPYRTWGYPVVPALFLLGSVFLLGNYLVSQPLTFSVDVGLIAVGIPVYYVWRHFQTVKSA